MTWWLDAAQRFFDPGRPSDREVKINGYMDDVNRAWPRDVSVYAPGPAVRVAQQALALANLVYGDLNQAATKYGPSGWGENITNLRGAVERRMEDLRGDLHTLLIAQASGEVQATVYGFKDHVWTLLRDTALGVRALDFASKNDLLAWVPDGIYHAGRLLVEAVGALFNVAVSLVKGLPNLLEIAKLALVGYGGYWLYKNVINKRRGE